MNSLFQKPLTIITGHYGSGKTEIAVNLAIAAAKSYQVVLADLDIVNPYFRSREQLNKLKPYHVEVIGSALMNSTLELPALTYNVIAKKNQENTRTIIDLGGDGIGAKQMSKYSKSIHLAEYELFLVVNVNRPETKHCEGVLFHKESIEQQSNMKITGILNNTHLLKETTEEDVFRGMTICQQVSQKTKIPFLGSFALETLSRQMMKKKLQKPVWPIELHMREQWMS